MAEILGRLGAGDGEIRVRGVQGPGRALLTALLFRRAGGVVVHCCATEKEAAALVEDLAFFLGPADVSLFPPLETVSTDMFTFQREAEFARVRVLHNLISGRPGVIVAPVKALLRRLLPRGALSSYCRTITIGDTVERDDLVRLLLEGGYTRETLVEEQGEFAVRGHVVDLFPPGAERAVRLEFVGDEIESVRDFDPATQRSQGERIDFTLLPAREVIVTETAQDEALRNLRKRAEEAGLPKTVRDRLVEKLQGPLVGRVNPLFFPLFYPEGSDALEAFFAYLPPGTVLVVDDEWACLQAAETAQGEAGRLVARAREEDRLCPAAEEILISTGEWEDGCRGFRRLVIEGVVLGIEEGDPVSFNWPALTGIKVDPAARDRREEGGLAPLVKRVRDWLASRFRVTFVCPGDDSRQRMAHLLEDYGLPVAVGTDGVPYLDLPAGEDGGLKVIRGRISGSLVLEDRRQVIVAAEDIFGKKVARRPFRAGREGYFLRSFGELREGDYVVHKDHGIGVYRGLKKIAVDGVENDFLLIEYAGSDKLFIPVDRLEAVQRYVGPEGYTPKVERLGGPSWEMVKERVKRSIREVAQELVAIYAAREVLDREAYNPPDRWDEEFAAAFPFEETPDQAQAIEDVHADMGRAKPMDRLVCGDAGFGKTEVALRAAFRAVMASRQVAVLVPTTILAEQHFRTFRERFRDYPVRVEVLNRLRSAAEQRAVVADVASGRVDIVVGTHRLLQKDVRFRDLGLVIIDEEQRFGVAHKERLKKLRTMVDVLTLTATPIPRTLHLSLVGIRDLSVINTPPEDRRPIKTYVVEFEGKIIGDAIRRELARGGQVFFLHDRVRSLPAMAAYVGKLVPEARIAVVHGQMKPRELEEAMAAFIRMEKDVLVCTTIIGSGLDIPTANTIIINRADRFGLAQLYQIRGRVGRSREEAYAYLLVPRGAMLSPDAARRLQVLMELSEPGSGFRIAANDLELRGAGNLLGLSQSGHVSAVGYELYTELMEKTIQELKGSVVVEDEIKPEIRLGVGAYIPSDYMGDENRRLVTYKRIAMARDEGELEEIRQELVDCWGFVPAEVDNLLQVIAIRNVLKSLRGKKLIHDGRFLTIAFAPDTPVDPARIVALAGKRTKGLRLTPDWRLIVPVSALGEGPPAATVKRFLATLM